MSIRDVSNLPDSQVPEWVRLSREADRESAAKRVEFLKDQKEEMARLMDIKTIRERFPNIWKALKYIAYDNGCVNRLSPEESLPDIPSSYVYKLSNLEMIAKRIGDELEAFCTHEETEVNNLIIKYNALCFSDFLTDWFETL